MILKGEDGCFYDRKIDAEHFIRSEVLDDELKR
jgi:hypothetical protein